MYILEGKKDKHSEQIIIKEDKRPTKCKEFELGDEDQEAKEGYKKKDIEAKRALSYAKNRTTAKI